MDLAVSPNLDQLQGLTAESAIVRQVSQTDIPELRAKMLRDAACALGARGGLAAESKELRSQFDGRLKQHLDEFAFGPLMLEDGLLPPVITQVNDAAKQDGANMIRLSGTVYRLERPERWVLSTPSWRDYVFQGLPLGDESIPAPHVSLLPKTEPEKAFWRRVVAECWQQGTGQAQAIVTTNLNRFERDYMGMVRYKLLVLEGKVVPPRVTREHRPVTGGGNEMTENDRIYRVDAPGRLNANPATWR